MWNFMTFLIWTPIKKQMAIAVDQRTHTHLLALKSPVQCTFQIQNPSKTRISRHHFRKSKKLWKWGGKYISVFWKFLVWKIFNHPMAFIQMTLLDRAHLLHVLRVLSEQNPSSNLHRRTQRPVWSKTATCVPRENTLPDRNPNFWDRHSKFLEKI